MELNEVDCSVFLVTVIAIYAILIAVRTFNILLYEIVDFVNYSKVVSREPVAHEMGVTGEGCVGRIDGRKLSRDCMPVEIPSF